MSILKEKKDRSYPYIYRGLVVDNNDPDKLGRVKIKIYPMFYNLETKFIPWSVPAQGIFAGAGADSGSFCIPSVDSFVFVFFEMGSIHQPVYFAEAQTAQKGIPIESQVNYPNRKVFKTSQGLTVFIDDSNNEINIKHPSGTSIVIDNLGKVLIDSNDIQLGDSLLPTDISKLLKVSDVLSGKLLSATAGAPVVLADGTGATTGTTKVTGV